MDEALRTADAYESNADADTETYRSGSVAADFGDRFEDGVSGCAG